MPLPVALDFHALADGVVRNNVGVDGITLCVRARADGDTAVLIPTDQRLPFAGAVTASATTPWWWFEVTGFDPDQPLALRYLGAAAAPGEPPATAAR